MRGLEVRVEQLEGLSPKWSSHSRALHGWYATAPRGGGPDSSCSSFTLYGWALNLNSGIRSPAAGEPHRGRCREASAVTAAVQLRSKKIREMRLTMRSPVRGFTLLELLVVMVIIGLLASYVAPRYFDQIGKSEIKSARAQLDAFDKALATYRLDTGRGGSA